MPRLTIDGRVIVAADGATVLDAARDAGIDIPSVCADPRFAPSGSCRLCVVEVAGRGRPVASCTMPVEEGITVETATPALVELRRTLLRLLASDYPADALTSDEPFHRLLAAHGVTDAAHGRSDPTRVDTSHPLIHVDLNRCISCWRCVRICEEVQGQFVWRIEDRGAGSRIVPDSGAAFAASSCVSCGACVDTCPTGALEDVNLVGSPPVDRWTRTTCPYCGVGCEMLVGTSGNRLVTIVPAADAPVNRGHLCVKGRYAHEFVHASDRQTSPMVRDGERWRTVSWEEAIASAVAGLRAALTEGGPGAVGVLASARATNEDNYVAQKLARAVLGTNNVDGCARVCHAPSAAGLATMFGTGAATSSFDDIEAAKTIVVCGSNTTEAHPIVGARIKQAARRGSRLIVIDPRRTELAEHAALHLQPRPGTNVPLLTAMAAVIVEEGLVDERFVTDRVDESDGFREFVAGWSPERAEEICGVPAADIRAAARVYATERPAISFHGLGVTEHTQGTETVICLANLALLTGNIGRRGAGVNPLRGQNNVQGAAHMGCEPAHLTGYAPLTTARDHFGSIWGAAIPDVPGLDAMQMIDAAGGGTLRALVVFGWDVLMTQPNTAETRRCLSQLDTVVIADLFLNETARELGTVFLPAASAFEKDGTFMNSERRVQRVRCAVPPPGDARPDWQIVGMLATALGQGDLFPYATVSDVWEEIRRVWPAGRGMTWQRLDAPGGLQWPCPTEGHPGTSILHADEFGGQQGRRAALRPVTHRPTPEQPDDAFPLALVTGRSLYRFNSGTMTGRSAARRLEATDRLEVSAEDAAALGIGSGDSLVVRSRHGEATLPAAVTDRVQPGTVFATFSDPQTAVNELTGPHRDDVTNTPEYKVTAVRLRTRG